MWQITLSGFSEGMLDAARHNLGDENRHFDFVVVEVQTISVEDNYFDAVIANHMLYHVPDRSQVTGKVIVPYQRQNGQ